jgi:hypothetical protein
MCGQAVGDFEHKGNAAISSLGDRLLTDDQDIGHEIKLLSYEISVYSNRAARKAAACIDNFRSY